MLRNLVNGVLSNRGGATRGGGNGGGVSRGAGGLGGATRGGGGGMGSAVGLASRFLRRR